MPRSASDGKESTPDSFFGRPRRRGVRLRYSPKRRSAVRAKPPHRFCSRSPSWASASSSGPVISGKTRQEVDEIVNLMVIKPIMGEIESCGEYGGVTPQTVRGMVYFLTGNCHI